MQARALRAGLGCAPLRPPRHVRPHDVRCQVTILEVLADQCGLAPYQIERVCRELERQPEPRPAEWVADRVAQLRATLPATTPLADLIYNGGAQLLEQDPAALHAQLERLHAALAGVNIARVVALEPQLLWIPGVDQLLPTVIAKLVALYPYKAANKRVEILKLVEEYPELLVRMRFYVGPEADKKIRRVQDLPVDLQNRILRNYC